MKQPLRHLLLATDFSDASKQALSYARWLQDALKCDLAVLHVFDPATLFMPAPYYFMAGVDKWIDDHLLVCRSRGQASLKELETDLGGKCTCHFVEGRPEKEIVRFTEAHEVDLLILGTHGHTGFNRLVLGSVAEYAVRHCRCPVMTIKPD